MRDANTLIRSTAAILADAERGATAMRIRAREEGQRKYNDDWALTYRRWRHDREALLAEHTRQCPFCDRELTPTVLELTKPVGVILVQPDRCGCEGERLHLAMERDRQVEAKRAFEDAEWLRAMNSAGLTGRLADATFDSYRISTPDQRRHKAAAFSYSSAFLQGKLEDRPWLVLYGPYGTGKTHLAAAIVHEAMTAGNRGCYVRPWTAYLRRLMDSFDRDAAERTGDITAELSAGRLVVIDDIDKRNPSKSGWAEAELFTALDARYRNRLPTVLTFNHSPLEMIPWIGAALVDRLRECQFDAVQFSGNSYRSGVDWRGA